MESNLSGTPIASFKGKSLSWKQVFLQVLPLMMVALSPALYGAWRVYYLYTFFGPAAVTKNDNNWFFASGVLILIISLLLLVRYIISTCQVTIHSEGIQIDKLFRNQVSILWDDIVEIKTLHYKHAFLNRNSQVNHRLLLRTNDGTYKLDQSLQDLEKLIGVIKEKTFPLILRDNLQGFDNGDSLKFGPIEINQSNLNFDVHQIDWKEIKRINISSGWLSIFLENDQKFRTKTQKIPNIEIFLAIAKKVLQK